MEKQHVDTERICLLLISSFLQKRENQLQLKRNPWYYSNLWRAHSMFTSYSVWLPGKSINIQIHILEPQPSKREWKFTMIWLDAWHWSCKRIKILWTIIELIPNTLDRPGWDNSLYSYGYQVTAFASFLQWEMSTVIVYSLVFFNRQFSQV